MKGRYSQECTSGGTYFVHWMLTFTNNTSDKKKKKKKERGFGEAIKTSTLNYGQSECCCSFERLSINSTSC